MAEVIHQDQVIRERAIKRLLAETNLPRSTIERIVDHALEGLEEE